MGERPISIVNQINEEEIVNTPGARARSRCQGRSGSHPHERSSAVYSRDPTEPSAASLLPSKTSCVCDVCSHGETLREGRLFFHHEEEVQ